MKASRAERAYLADIESAFPRLMSFDEMLGKIYAGASLTRFGDGEFGIALARSWDNIMQNASDELSDRLFGILARPSDDKLIVAIPPYNALHDNMKKYWKDLSFFEWFWMNNWKHLGPLLNNPVYGNSFLSRLDVFHEMPISKLTQIWAGRDVVFVVPSNGRFEYDERLFGNVKSRTEVTVPPVQAFAEYDRILNECLAHARENVDKRMGGGKLFFIAAGPTATVLAADLADRGHQALDMGHLPNCYKEFLGEAAAPEKQPFVKEK